MTAASHCPHGSTSHGTDGTAGGQLDQSGRRDVSRWRRPPDVVAALPAPEPVAAARAVDDERRVRLAAHPVAHRLVARLAHRRGVTAMPIVSRAARPVTGSGLWFVSDVDTARDVLVDQDHYTKSGPGSMGAIISQVLGPGLVLNADGDAHLVLRRSLQSAFAPAALAPTLASWRTDLDRATGVLDRGGVVDLAHVSRQLTAAAACHVLGLEDTPRHRRRVLTATAGLVGMLTPMTRELSAHEVARATSHHRDLTAGFDRAWANPPSESVIASLRTAGLTMDQARGMVTLLLVTGTFTVATALPRLVQLACRSGLADHVAALDADDRTRALGHIVDEGLRVVVPSPVMLRSVARDHHRHGHHLRRGDRMVVVTDNLARDPHHSTDPNGLGRQALDWHRSHSPGLRHLWFGVGSHFCLGFPLAHAQLRAGLDSLLARRVEVVASVPARHVLIPTHRSLRVRVRP